MHEAVRDLIRDLVGLDDLDFNRAEDAIAAERRSRDQARRERLNRELAERQRLHSAAVLEHLDALLALAPDHIHEGSDSDPAPPQLRQFCVRCMLLDARTSGAWPRDKALHLHMLPVRPAEAT